MPIEIIELIDVEGRNTEDVLDYVFKVSDGRLCHNVRVGIPGPGINPVGQQPRTKESLKKVAEDWLRYHLDVKRFDPFKQSSGRIPDVPAAIVDYWFDKGKLPPHLYPSS